MDSSRKRSATVIIEPPPHTLKTITVAYIVKAARLLRSAAVQSLRTCHTDGDELDRVTSAISADSTHQFSGGATAGLSIQLHHYQGAAPPFTLSSRPERTRISCYAALTNARVCGFQYGKPHEVLQRHQARQEIRGSVAEGSAVSLSGTAKVAWGESLGFRFSINANCRSLRYAALRSG